MSSVSFKNVTNKLFPYKSYIEHISTRLDTLNWLTPSFLKKNLPQNFHMETNI